MSDEKIKKAGKNRRKSRELALKGMYQCLLSGGSAEEIASSLSDDPDYARADQSYFQALLCSVIEHQAELDSQLRAYLDREVAGLSPVEHAILCIAGYELIHDASIPYRVVINEGVELAKRYGGTDGYKYVNGVLDKLAADTRSSEVKRGRTDTAGS
jgi:N utilization substance protein B